MGIIWDISCLKKQCIQEKTAQMIAECLYDILESHHSTVTCLVVGGDSCHGNSGWKGGTKALLEKMLGHECHWAVCMLHTNELPLRHLIKRKYGPTSSSTGFNGR